MRAMVVAIISATVLFFILIAMWLPFDTTISNIEDFTNNSTMIKNEYKNYASDLYNNIRTWFTFAFVVSLACIPIGYGIDSFRREHEEFQEYDRYGPY